MFAVRRMGRPWPKMVGPAWPKSLDQYNPKNDIFDIARLFRWCIAGRAFSERHRCRGQGRQHKMSRDSKIDEPEIAVGIANDILRLNISMDDFYLFRFGEGFENVET